MLEVIHKQKVKPDFIEMNNLLLAEKCRPLVENRIKLVTTHLQNQFGCKLISRNTTVYYEECKAVFKLKYELFNKDILEIDLVEWGKEFNIDMTLMIDGYDVQALVIENRTLNEFGKKKYSKIYNAYNWIQHDLNRD